MIAVRRLYGWFTSSKITPGERAPVEAILARAFGLASLTLFIVGTITNRPRPGLHGNGLVVLLAALVVLASAAATRFHKAEVPAWQRIAALLAVSAGGAVLASKQPNGIWEAVAYFVAIIASLRLDRRAGITIVVLSIAILTVGGITAHRSGAVIGTAFGAIPWFLIMRLFRVMRDQRDEIQAARVGEAQAAADAERGRVAREMHDVLAHTLSALALQLESTRLLARDRNADPDVARAVDQAHHLAASGLQEARRAIATTRGDELPGPERLGALADAFGEQSGLPVEIEVSGEPRDLAPEARLAVYRTAQEALTNVSRHATAERVEMRLVYLPASTVLVVEDHAVPGAPPPVSLGLAGDGFGLTGMRERAELLGGELLAAPTQEGFRVELRLPVGG
jgi:signal transduction histidine kinase